MKYQVDQSGKIEQINKDSVIAYSNGQKIAILIPRRLRRIHQSIKKDRWAFKRMSFNSGRRSVSIYG